MSFDARSLERLQALGRSLPKPLPKPEPPPQTSPKATDKRHRVELEENPEALFRELMQVSPDGTVPPHLMERLRELEAQRQPPAAAPQQALPTAARRPGERKRGASPQGKGLAATDDSDLYTVFQQLLLEDEEEP
jgi:hypothetical protein